MQGWQEEETGDSPPLSGVGLEVSGEEVKAPVVLVFFAVSSRELGAW